MYTPAALVLIALWILGVFYSDMGPYIHILPVVAVSIIGYRFMERSRNRKKSNK